MNSTAPTEEGPIITKQLMLLEAHACAESPEYIFACTISGAAERAGLWPNGKDFSERHHQTKVFMGELIERFTSALDTAIAAERERCAGIVDDWAAKWEELGDYGINQGYVRMIEAANKIESAIREGKIDA